MKREHSVFQKVRLYFTVATIYALTLGFGWTIVQPEPFVSEVTARAVVHQEPVFQLQLITGKPTRIVIPDSGIDLVVEEGQYSDSDRSWTLSRSNAQYAMNTTLANNFTGNTLIYGHGTAEVLGKLNDTTPAIGAEALVYTSEGRIFSYRFENVRNLAPDDTSIFDYTGPAILTVQTCRGEFSEWRSMFQFAFDKVVQ